MSDINWYCPDCGTVLGRVIGGELQGIEGIPSTAYETRGANLKVTCPNCQRAKVWYTSDTVVRAIFQLISSISSEVAFQAIKQMAAKVREGELNK